MNKLKYYFSLLTSWFCCISAGPVDWSEIYQWIYTESPYYSSIDKIDIYAASVFPTDNNGEANYCLCSPKGKNFTSVIRLHPARQLQSPTTEQLRRPLSARSNPSRAILRWAGATPVRRHSGATPVTRWAGATPMPRRAGATRAHSLTALKYIIFR